MDGVAMCHARLSAQQWFFFVLPSDGQKWVVMRRGPTDPGLAEMADKLTYFFMAFPAMPPERWTAACRDLFFFFFFAQHYSFRSNCTALCLSTQVATKIHLRVCTPRNPTFAVLSVFLFGMVAH